MQNKVNIRQDIQLNRLKIKRKELNNEILNINKEIDDIYLKYPKINSAWFKIVEKTINEISNYHWFTK